MFAQFSLPINVVFFTAAATVVWFSGARITRYADEFSERFKLSRALMGLLLFRMGRDSAAVLVVYLGGLYFLFQLRS
ncbi:MAG TPA: hypothetical protein VIC26_05030 [Marinagarivorans sp.]